MKNFGILLISAIFALSLFSCKKSGGGIPFLPIGGGNGGNSIIFVVFNSMGGSAVSDQLVTNGENAVEPAPPVKTGYLFGGWFLDTSYDTLWDFNTDVVTDDITLYAKWDTYSYIITFDSQSATVEASPTSKNTASPATTVDALPTAPTKSGYYFAGWYTGPNGTGTEFIATTVVTDNNIVYAFWTTNPTYTVTFNKQGATTPPDPTSITVVPPAVDVGVLPGAPLKTGYLFGGWFTETGGGGSEFLADTTVSKDIIVYAKWVSYSHTVTFDSDGGSLVLSKTVASPDTTVGTLPEEPTKDGYSFGGWWTEIDGGGTQFNGGTAVSGDITVYANWVSNENTITFNANNGTGSMDPQMIFTGETEPLTANAYTRAGYTFAGWATTDTGSVEYLNGADYLMGMASVTLYAKWTENNYMVSFSPNGGEGTMEPQTITCGATAALTLNAFTRDGYSFTGWTTSSDGDIVYYDSAGYTMGTESVVLYARWVWDNTTALRVYGQGGSFTSNIVVSADGLDGSNGIAVGAGGVYIADTMNNRVLYYSGTSTTATRVYGQGGSFTSNTDNNGGISADSLSRPGYVFEDASGVYIADTNNHRVLYYSGTSTTATRVYGQGGSFTSNTNNNGGVSADSLYGPRGISVDAGGVYIADTNNNRVLYYSGTSTTATRVYGQGGSFTSNTNNNGGVSADSLYSPRGLSVDSGGVYIADTNNNRVLYYSGTSTSATRVYGQGGNFTTNTVNNGGISANSLNSPRSVSVYASGLYVADGYNYRVLYYSGTSTTATRVYGQGGSFTSNTDNNGGISADSLSRPGYVFEDASGVYIADTNNNRVLYYSGTSTTATRVYGQGGSFTFNASNNNGFDRFDFPADIAVDSSGVYIADTENHRVLFYPGSSTTATRVYGQGGSFTSGAENNGGISADSLYRPSGVAVDTGGVYIADKTNNRVLYYSGTSTTATRVYGQSGSFTSYTTNNGGVSADSLNTPRSIAVDAGGVYIADLNNHRVLYYSGTSTTATRVYGQGGSFTTNTANKGGINYNSLAGPCAVAVDSGGVYIVDGGNNRVLYFSGTSTTATRVYGQGGSFGTNTANKGGISPNSLNSPVSVITGSSGVYIADSSNHRVLYYAGSSTTAMLVYGQWGSFATNSANNSGISADSLFAPYGLAIYTNRLYVVDAGNNRVLFY